MESLTREEIYNTLNRTDFLSIITKLKQFTLSVYTTQHLRKHLRIRLNLKIAYTLLSNKNRHLIQ